MVALSLAASTRVCNEEMLLVISAAESLDSFACSQQSGCDLENHCDEAPTAGPLLAMGEA